MGQGWGGGAGVGFLSNFPITYKKKSVPKLNMTIVSIVSLLNFS